MNVKCLIWYIYCAVCGGHYTGDSGEIDYPLGDMTNYAHNQSCSYIIESSEDKVINVTFIDFHLESGSNCIHDWLQIHDGRDASARILGRFCGTQGILFCLPFDFYPADAIF